MKSRTSFNCVRGDLLVPVLDSWRDRGVFTRPGCSAPLRLSSFNMDVIYMRFRSGKEVKYLCSKNVCEKIRFSSVTFLIQA